MSTATLATNYEQAITKIKQAAEAELKRGFLRGFSLAMVDGDQIVFADGFGLADHHTGKKATSQTVYRCGSISKLFNAVGVMQLVEQGKLDLDAPITQYDPEFHITDPVGCSKPITARQLLCHRGGMIRESPEGNYYDESAPGIEATVRSVARSVMVNPADTQTRYSNVGPTICGHIVARQSGQSFEDYQDNHVLKPMGMNDSSWGLNDAVRENLAVAGMAMAQPDGTFVRNDAPVFDLGTLPAGNLYTTAEDLSRFMMCVLGGGSVGGKQILAEKTLNEMFTTQLVSETEGFGVAFRISKVGEYKAVSHNGAVYGFSSAFIGIPELGIGVIVLISEDVSGGPLDRLTFAALDAMIEAKAGQSPIKTPQPRNVPAAELQRFVGEYESQSYWASVKMDGAKLVATISGQPVDITPVEPCGFIINGKKVFNGKAMLTQGDEQRYDTLTMLNQTFRRVDTAAVQPLPQPWRAYLGSYGPLCIPAVISERHGHLYVMTENIYDYRLTPVSETVFAMPPGLYTDEYLVFQMNESGEAYSILMSNIPLKRGGR